MLLAEVENMAALRSVHCRGSGGMLPQEILIILGVLRCILGSTQSFLRRGLSSKSSLLADLDMHGYWNTENHLHRLGSI